MGDVLHEDVEAVLAHAGTEPEPPLPAMAEHGRDRGFPIIGPDAGRFLRLLASMVDAGRIFEFGSGFGYSAAWFLGALPPEGEIVLTDFERENLDEAEEFLADHPSGATVHTEAGDAMETFRDYDGPFDVVLVDHDKTQYVDALDLARPELADGAVVVADNVLSGPASAGEVRAVLEGGVAPGESAAGLAAYVEHVRDDVDAESVLVPLGSGLLVSYFD